MIKIKERKRSNGIKVKAVTQTLYRPMASRHHILDNRSRRDIN